MILVIDNYDSFTYNLVQYLSEFDIQVEVFRNNKIEISEIMKKNLLGIVISPGPGTPYDAGISIELIKIAGPEIPILGVCLGHQAIAVAYGGRVLPGKKLMHGKPSNIYHQQKGIYRGIESPFLAGRYHSLVIDANTFPDCLEINAQTDDNIIMGVQHKEYPVIGMQYHPESILTKKGKVLLENFIDFAKEHKKDSCKMKKVINNI